MTIDDTLVAYRPSDDELVTEWPAPERAELRDRIVAEPREAGQRGPEHGRGRWVGRHRRAVAIGTLAACLAAAGIVVGVALPGGPGAPDAAGAASLEHLALVAGAQGGTVGPHQFAYTATSYVESVEEAGGHVPLGYTRDGDVIRWHAQQWTAPNGDVWLYRALGRTYECLREYPAHLADSTAYGYENLSAAALASLPTDADRLAAYLDAHPSGDNRGVANRFTSIADLVRSGLATPALRAAALRVLARTGGVEVETGTHDAAGRAAIRVDYPQKYGTASLFFDPRTSQLLEEGGRDRRGKESSSNTLIMKSMVVDAIPRGLTPCPPPLVQPG